jgi:dTDP-4-dehydrorhamnose reductase
MVDDRRGATLVLGGSGFLGAHVLSATIRASDRRTADGAGSLERVISAGRVEPPEYSPAGRAPALRMSRTGEPAPNIAIDVPPRKADWCPLDALHSGAARELCERLDPARVIVCTALSMIPECEAYPGLARALNVDLPRDVAGWCAESGARMLLVSTDLVFGAVAPPPSGFDERASPAPISHYGRTKAQGEEAVLATDARGLVVRLPLLFGDSGGRALGASDRVVQAVERGEPLAMFIDEWRTPLDVAAAAEALVELAHGEQCGILHVAGPERVSRYELALHALLWRGFTRAEARARITSTTRRAAALDSTRPEDVSLDGSRARTFLRTKLAGPSERASGLEFERRTKEVR